MNGQKSVDEDKQPKSDSKEGASTEMILDKDQILTDLIATRSQMQALFKNLEN